MGYDKLFQELSKQMNSELLSAYLYLSISSFCANAGYEGFSNYFMKQAFRQQDHARLLFHYISQRGELASIAEIPSLEKEYTSLPQLCKAALKHQEESTVNFLNLMTPPSIEYEAGNGAKPLTNGLAEKKSVVPDTMLRIKYIGKN